MDENINEKKELSIEEVINELENLKYNNIKEKVDDEYLTYFFDYITHFEEVDSDNYEDMIKTTYSMAIQLFTNFCKCLPYSGINKCSLSELYSNSNVINSFVF